MVVVGRGRVGRSLTRALRAAGRTVSLVAGREGPPTLPASGLVFLTVPDRAVRDVARALARHGLAEDAAVVHTSGAMGLDALAPLKHHPVGSFHPLQAFPVPRDPTAFSGITMAIEASTPALKRRLFKLARELGSRPRHVPDRDRVAYHAAGVFASNYANVAFVEGVRLLESIGWTETESVHALLPLLEGAVAGIHEHGPVLALTGPIRRGDVGTVRKHLAALHELDGRTSARREEGLEGVYRMLGSIALGIALQAGLEPAAARRMRRALTRQVAATRRRGRQ